MGETVSVDYLVVGAGAMGMAFADTLLTETNATIAIVDRNHRPGGHWTTAYPFVRLHQPSWFYGVNSKPLGQDRIEQVGWNKGLYELATGDEVCAYYSQVMNETFLPSKRVLYYPKCEYIGDGQCRSIVTGKTFRVNSTKVVDATYMRVAVPSTTPPAYGVGEDVTLVTPNDLVKISKPYQEYTVVGAGKTGIDVCLWLLWVGIEPAQITWIVSRDSWLFDRANMQPGRRGLEIAQAGMEVRNKAIMTATSVNDLFDRLEASGQLWRLSDDVRPTAFRCATVSLAELEQIRKIKNVIRLGRVLQINSDEVKLVRGSYKPAREALFIDCSAHGTAKQPPVPVFSGNKITLQPVRFCQQVFSAAFIANIETIYSDDQMKNGLCQPIPHPKDDIDWLTINIQTITNALRWGTEPRIGAWMSKARLDWFGSGGMPEDPEQRRVVVAAMIKQMHMVCDKLGNLIKDRRSSNL